MPTVAESGRQRGRAATGASREREGGSPAVVSAQVDDSVQPVLVVVGTAVFLVGLAVVAGLLGFGPVGDAPPGQVADPNNSTLTPTQPGDSTATPTDTEPAETATDTPTPTETAGPTESPTPTETPIVPTDSPTPIETETPMPTRTESPTATPTPTPTEPDIFGTSASATSFGWLDVLVEELMG